MRRTGLLIAGWALATVFALALGMQAVSAISNSVTNHRKPSLSPASVKAALNRSTSSSTEENASIGSADPSESSASPAAGSAPSASADGGVPPAVPGVVDDHRNASPPPENVVTDGGGASDASSQEHDSSSGPPPVASPEDRTYQLVGGSVGVRFENGAARLLWATPATGFSVQSSGHGSVVDVRFRSDKHESRLRAFWENGPQQEIEEDDH